MFEVGISQRLRRINSKKPLKVLRPQLYWKRRHPIFICSFNTVTSMKIYQLAILVVLSVVFLGCDKPDVQTTPAWIGQDASLVVTPKQASKNDTVKLTFPVSHPQNIAIKSPAGEWYTIHGESESILLMPDSEFKSATSIQLHLSSVMGTKWVEGRAVNEAVFTEPGSYIIYMADNLETDPENTFFISNTIELKSSIQ